MNVPLAVLSAGAIRRSVTRVAERFEQQTQRSVAVDFAPAPQVRERVLAGEYVDVVIASAGVLDRLARALKIDGTTRAPVGRTGMAVMIRAGTAAPDLSDTDRFRHAMLEASLVVYNAGSSGAHAATVIDRLGLRPAMSDRIKVVERGPDMVELVATSPERVVGLAQLTNVLDQVANGVAVTLAAPFPPELQNVTSYEIAVTAAPRDRVLAREFVAAFASAEARTLLSEAGLE